MSDKFKIAVEELLSLAGIEINGSHPWDIRVHNDKLYRRVLSQGSLGLGESYMDGWWDCDALDEFIDKILKADLASKVEMNWRLLWHGLRAKLFNLQSRERAYEVGEKHYNLGNDLYRAMLDKRMNYSCGYWKNASNLDEAQEAKLELICRKLGFQTGMKVLDIGCGWGSFAKYAAEKYGVEVMGITVSQEQATLGRELCKGLPVEIRLQDYRELNEEFDRIVSIGMFEHVGYKNYRTYMKTTVRCLKDDGIAFIHTIGGNISNSKCEPWIDKYIFPNVMFPSMLQIAKAMEGLFVMEDWHNFGPDYDKTLMAWHDNFENSWPKLKDKYGERFRRMWRYYLLSSAGGFRAQDHQLWQIVFSKKGIPGGYNSIR